MDRLRHASDLSDLPDPSARRPRRSTCGRPGGSRRRPTAAAARGARSPPAARQRRRPRRVGGPLPLQPARRRAPPTQSRRAARRRPIPGRARRTVAGAAGHGRPRSAVQRLPVVGLPEPQTRGLTYGSLWLTFHGLQWPYMPAIDQRRALRRRPLRLGLGRHRRTRSSRPGATNAAASTQDRIKYWKQQARMLLRVTPTYSFDRRAVHPGPGRARRHRGSDDLRSDVGGADTDDLWLRIGQWNRWDFQVGRFEGWEVFHLGMGLDQNTFERQGAVGAGRLRQSPFYGLTDNQFRPGGAAGNAAFHYYPLPFLRFELLGMAGSFSGDPVVRDASGRRSSTSGGSSSRAASSTSTDGLDQHATDRPTITSKGVGGAIQFVFVPHIEFGAQRRAGHRLEHRPHREPEPRRELHAHELRRIRQRLERQPTASAHLRRRARCSRAPRTRTTSIRNPWWTTTGCTRASSPSSTSLFNAFYIKLVGGYSRGSLAQAGNDPRVEYDDEMYSVRLRFSFYF